MINLQDLFLNQVRKNKTCVTIFLINGVQVRGKVIGFDRFTIVVQMGEKQQVFMKHAVSTIQPVTPVSLVREENPSA